MILTRNHELFRTRLRAPVEVSDKHQQLLNRGGRCLMCLHKNNSTARLTGVRSTPIWYRRVLRRTYRWQKETCWFV